VEHSRRVHNNSENTVFERFGDIEDILLGVHGEASGVGEAAVDDGLEHADTQVNHEQTADGVLKRALTKRSTVGEEKGVGSLGEEHGVGSFKGTSIEILDNGNDLNSVVSDGLG